MKEHTESRLFSPTPPFTDRGEHIIYLWALGFTSKEIPPLLDINQAQFDYARDSIPAALQEAEINFSHCVQPLLDAGRIDFSLFRNPLPRLTYNQGEILKALGEGLSISDIATKYHISRKTVESYTERMRLKLGVRTTNQAITYYLGRRRYVTSQQNEEQ